MRSMNASTASIWASSSRSWRLREHRPRLHQVLVEAGQLVAALDQRRRRAAEQAVELRDPRAAGDRGDRAQRRDQRDLGEVERARDQRDRRDRQLRVGAERQQREDAAEAPAHDLHGPAAGVLGGGADRARHDLLDPVLEPERAVGVLDLAVVDEVGRAAALHEVLGHASSRAAGRSRSPARPAAGRAAPGRGARAAARRTLGSGGSGGRCAAALRRSPSRASAAGRRAPRRARRRRRWRPPRRTRVGVSGITPGPPPRCSRAAAVPIVTIPRRREPRARRSPAGASAPSPAARPRTRAARRRPGCR